MSDNDMQSTYRGVSVTWSTAALGQLVEPLDKCVIQRNAMHDFNSDQIISVSYQSPFTVRDNICWNVGTYDNGITPSGGIVFLLVYPPFDINSIPSNPGHPWTVTADTQNKEILFYRNYLSSANTNSFSMSLAINIDWVMKGQYTDNVFFYTSTSARAWDVDVFSTFASLGHLIDRNAYYQPNNVNIATDDSGSATFAQWKAFGDVDANSTNTDLGWLDPLNTGDFRTSVETASIGGRPLRAMRFR